MSVECNGLCVRAYEILPVGTAQIAYAHPDCPAHGNLAVYDVDGTPRTGAGAVQPEAIDSVSGAAPAPHRERQ